MRSLLRATCALPLLLITGCGDAPPTVALLAPVELAVGAPLAVEVRGTLDEPADVRVRLHAAGADCRGRHLADVVDAVPAARRVEARGEVAGPAAGRYELCATATTADGSRGLARRAVTVRPLRARVEIIAPSTAESYDNVSVRVRGHTEGTHLLSVIATTEPAGCRAAGTPDGDAVGERPVSGRFDVELQAAKPEGRWTLCATLRADAGAEHALALGRAELLVADVR